MIIIRPGELSNTHVASHSLKALGIHLFLRKEMTQYYLC